ncbi:MAG: hypothetical protein HY673_08020 [Chloroflexi bacterium]|nr:hypothetical protein [Chloroflexota bacterium]
MKGSFARLAILVLVGLPFVACQPPAAPTGITPPVVKPPAISSKQAWEQKWETAVAEGKKEGSVSVYALWGS